MFNDDSVSQVILLHDHVNFEMILCYDDLVIQIIIPHDHLKSQIVYVQDDLEQPFCIRKTILIVVTFFNTVFFLACAARKHVFSRKPTSSD